MTTAEMAKSDTWIEEATNQLRWVLSERGPRTHVYKPELHLQQLFVRTRGDGMQVEKEWRDVPTVTL